MTAAKLTALTAAPALLAAPCLSSLALAAAGLGAMVAGYLLAGLNARRQWNEDSYYAALAEALAEQEADAFIDYPAFYGR